MGGAEPRATTACYAAIAWPSSGGAGRCLMSEWLATNHMTSCHGRAITAEDIETARTTEQKRTFWHMSYPGGKTLESAVAQVRHAPPDRKEGPSDAAAAGEGAVPTAGTQGQNGAQGGKLPKGAALKGGKGDLSSHPPDGYGTTRGK